MTSKVAALNSGFHGAPMVIEAARPWAIDLTRKLKWPVAVAVLQEDAVFVRFSTIADSPVSPFHATINLRLSLMSRALGRAYLAYCPKEERQLLVRMLSASDHAEDRPKNLARAVQQLVRATRSRGFAERDPNVEPQNSNTIAVPVMANGLRAGDARPDLFSLGRAALHFDRHAGAGAHGDPRSHRAEHRGDAHAVKTSAGHGRRSAP